MIKPFLPPLEEFIPYIERIWENEWLTNFGQFSLELEQKLKKYFNVKHLFFVSNGTIALQIAIKALDLKGEIITTPFSYIATSSSIIWEGCNPVFVDIDEDSLNLDASKIEKAITKKTKAIIATHVFGNPCNVVAINKIARKHNLKVIYDAAHAFGVNISGNSVLINGDISTISFHATKIFNTIEGGAIITNNDSLAEKIFYLRNFGHFGASNPEKFLGVGINGKNSELHASMGLCLLPKMKKIIKKRLRLSGFYDNFLEGQDVRKQKILKSVDYNFSYYPVIFSSEDVLLKVVEVLNKNNVYPRRYFFPSLNTVDYIKKKNKQSMPISESISSRILCLPLFHNLEEGDIRRISHLIINSLQK